MAKRVPAYDPTPAKRYIDMTCDERRKSYNDLLDAGEILGRTIGTMIPSRSAVERNTRELVFLLRVAKSRGDEWIKSK
jgi:hypothetical protein